MQPSTSTLSIPIVLCLLLVFFFFVDSSTKIYYGQMTQGLRTAREAYTLPELGTRQSDC